MQLGIPNLVVPKHKELALLLLQVLLLLGLLPSLLLALQAPGPVELPLELAALPLLQLEFQFLQ